MYEKHRFSLKGGTNLSKVVTIRTLQRNRFPVAFAAGLAAIASVSIFLKKKDRSRL